MMRTKKKSPKRSPAPDWSWSSWRNTVPRMIPNMMLRMTRARKSCVRLRTLAHSRRILHSSWRTKLEAYCLLNLGTSKPGGMSFKCDSISTLSCEALKASSGSCCAPTRGVWLLAEMAAASRMKSAGLRFGAHSHLVLIVSDIR